MGETARVPLAATAPIPGAIETEVAFAVLQVRVVLWPLEIDPDEVVNCAAGAGGAVTVTTAVLVMV